MDFRELCRVYLEYFPAHISLLSDLGQFCLHSDTLFPVHLCQTMGLLQILLQYLMKVMLITKRALVFHICPVHLH